MKKRLTNFIDWFLYQFDRIIGYMMTSSRKLPYYHRHMYEKYGTRYCTQEEFDAYWAKCTD